MSVILYLKKVYRRDRAHDIRRNLILVFLKIMLTYLKKTSITDSLRDKMPQFGYNIITVCITISQGKVWTKLHSTEHNTRSSTSTRVVERGEVKNE